MAKPKATTRKTSIKKVAGFVVRVNVNGQEIQGAGASIDEALLALPKVQAKTRAVITIEAQGKASRPIYYTIMAFNRLFFPGMTGDVQRTQLTNRYEFFA